MATGDFEAVKRMDFKNPDTLGMTAKIQNLQEVTNAVADKNAPLTDQEVVAQNKLINAAAKSNSPALFAASEKVGRGTPFEQRQYINELGKAVTEQQNRYLEQDPNNGAIKESRDRGVALEKQADSAFATQKQEDRAPEKGFFQKAAERIKAKVNGAVNGFNSASNDSPNEKAVATAEADKDSKDKGYNNITSDMVQKAAQVANNTQTSYKLADDPSKTPGNAGSLTIGGGQRAAGGPDLA